MTAPPEESARLRDALRAVYAAAAENPDPSLCCVGVNPLAYPDLVVPQRCREMDYGCGSTVSPSDLRGDGRILYVGVGGGLEALQFAYFRRRPGGVVAVDPIAEMRDAARENLREAARQNPWFDPSFVEIVEGDASALPAADGTVGVVAQNCLFNVFHDSELDRALDEVARVLAPGGVFTASDPIAERPLPEAIRRDTTLRARCIAGCRSFAEYTAAIFAAGFASIEIRSRRPYRLLLPHEFAALGEPLLLESVDLVARRAASTVAPEPPRLFTGRTAIHVGREGHDHRGMRFAPGVPVAVSDCAAAELAARSDFVITPPTWSVANAGCC